MRERLEEEGGREREISGEREWESGREREREIGHGDKSVSRGGEMDARKVVVMVEDMEIARTALRWALQNLLRYGDLITLLHVYHHPTSSRSSRNKKKLRLLRLQGYHLALSFKEICNSFPNVNKLISISPFRIFLLFIFEMIIWKITEQNRDCGDTR